MRLRKGERRGVSPPVSLQNRQGKFHKERYTDARATLTRCDRNHPLTLAFVALTRHQLGEKEQARTALAELRRAMTANNTKPLEKGYTPEVIAAFREAAALIEDKPAQPGP